MVLIIWHNYVIVINTYAELGKFESDFLPSLVCHKAKMCVSDPSFYIISNRIVLILVIIGNW